MQKQILILAAILTAFVIGAQPLSADSAISSVSADFALEFNGELVPYTLMSTFLLPGESLTVRAIATHDQETFLPSVEAGSLIATSSTEWLWQLPTEPGFYRLTVEDFTSGKVICIKAFVMVPYHGTEELNGYRIGTYESEPMENDPTSGPPKGFIEVTPENMNTWVSPNFQLKQFLCKQEAEFPKYMLLRTRLLLKLEMVAEDLERTHGEPPVLHVMSAYRTPYYNRRIGNRTKYSRHLFGDAADIFLDNNNDEWMDDLSGDGRVSTHDAGIMYEQIDTLYQTSWYDPFIGGMGLYGPKYDRGPFVHVDTRGYHARWGDKRGKTWLRAKGLVIEDSNSIVDKRLVDEPVTYDIDSRFRKFERVKR